MAFAEIAVGAPAAGRRLYTYEVPPNLTVQPGTLVWIPFGNQVCQGLVFSLSRDTTVPGPRPVTTTVYPFPLLDAAHLELATWIAREYLSSLYGAVSLMLPPDTARTVRLRELLWRTDGPPPGDLTRHQELVLSRLAPDRPVPVADLRPLIRRGSLDVVLEQLQRRGLVLRRVDVESGPRPRHEHEVWRLTLPAAEALERLRGTSRRRRPALERVLEVLSCGPLATSDLRTAARTTPRQLQELQQIGILELCPEPPVPQTLSATTPWPPLTAAQTMVWEAIQPAIGSHDRASTFLLHGVTGSGKTEIYLRAVNAAVQIGRQAIVLVPEIALTPQTLNRFDAHFPGRVAVIHSRLTAAERRAAWWRIQRGLADVVVGSRSAVFAPLANIGVIVVDEEHEWSYKQQDYEPRYHARDVSIALGRSLRVPVILGSATPDVVSYYRALRAEYQLLQLPERVAPPAGAGGATPVAVPLPEVEVVDMRRELRDGNRSMFSRYLLQSIERVLDNREQVILFLNRRGTATSVVCRSCGYVVECRSCAMAMTFHADVSQLVCHLCNRRRSVPVRCPKCHDPRIRMLGIGTQKVETAVAEAFPQARVVRWDRDAVRTAKAHEQILKTFLDGDADVMVGTQMVAKGLHLPNVSLVGVILADVGLQLPDIRAAEHSFQLLSQVAGRAGRETAGRAIFQTYTPDHFVIQSACRHDYREFARRELTFRREQRYPPFSRITRLVFRGSSDAAAQREATRLVRSIRETILSQGVADVEVVGPAPCYLRKVRGRWRWHLLLRGREAGRLLHSTRLPRGWAIDVDPVTLL